MPPDGDLDLRIHDESRTWRIWTQERPHFPMSDVMMKKPVTKSVAQQCIELVNEHESSKVGEIKALLKKIPSREYNILNYNSSLHHHECKKGQSF